MKSNIKRKISSILCMSFIMHLVNLSVYANETEIVDLGETVQINEAIDDLLDINNNVTDRFIVKYVSEDDGHLQNALDKAFKSAVEDKEDRVEDILINRGIELNNLKNDFESIDLNDVLDNISDRKVKKLLSRDVIFEKAEIEQLNYDMKIVRLNEKIEPETFIQNVLSEMNDEIEYIQPDYQFELSADDDTNDVLVDEVKIEDEIILGEEDKVSLEIDKSDENLDTISDSSILEDESSDKKEEVIVALIDGDVDTEHELLCERIYDSWDFVNECKIKVPDKYIDKFYHATHVAGIIAQNAPNVKIMPLKVFNDGKAYTSDIIKAIEYAENHGAKIVNCSWGSTDNNELLKQTIKNSNMIFVCAAGNDRIDLRSTCIYPACFGLPNIISVTSSNNDGGLSYFSNFGNVDIAAPGKDIKSAYPNNEYGIMSGTSMSAGFVSATAGELAVLEEENIKDRILLTADKIDCIMVYVKNGNRLNVENSFNNVINNEIIHIVPDEPFYPNNEYDTKEEWELFNSITNQQVAVGRFHTAVLKSDGTVWCWGYNNYGQLGDGTYINKSLPVKVIGLDNVVKIAAGGYSTVALKSDGSIWSWGINRGIAGNGTTTKSNVPVRMISPPSNIKDISLKSTELEVTTLAILTDEGEIYACGDNSYNIITQENEKQILTPIIIDGISDVKQVEVGVQFIIALKNDGTVYTWGCNYNGQLGNGTTINNGTPSVVQGVDNIVYISAGFKHCVAVKNDGTAYAWGINTNYQLGDNTTVNKTTPVIVKNATGIKKIWSGISSNIFIKDDYSLWAWGGNSYGVLGIGSNISKKSEIKINGLSNVISASIYESHAAAVTADGKIYTWGYDKYGQIGTGKVLQRLFFNKIPNLSDIIQISSGRTHALALKSDKTVISWGGNSYYQLGRSGNIDNGTPQIVTRINNVKQIATGDGYSVTLGEDGYVRCFGKNTYGQLGGGNTSSNYISPITVSGLSDVIKVDAGSDHTLSLKADGTVWCWGYNGYGQLGNGTKTNSVQPVQVQDLTDIIDISAGDYFNLALKSDGTAWAWGMNNQRQLGNDSNVSSSIPVQVMNLENITHIDTYKYSSFAATDNGDVYAWGNNNFYQLGDGTREMRGLPYKILNVENIKEINDGRIITDDGKVIVWGENGYGQLGLGNKKNQSLPVALSYMDDVISMDSYYTGLILKSDGTVWSSGENSMGVLGDNSKLYYVTPYCVENNVITQHSFMNITASANEISNICVNNGNIPNIEDYNLSINFSPQDFILVDACGLTKEIELESGIIPESNIEIVKIENGLVEFKIYNSSEESFSENKIINIIKLKSRYTGTYTIESIIAKNE